MKKKFYLTSPLGFVLAFIFLLITLSLSILFCIYHKEVGIFAIIVSFLFFLFALFGTIIILINTITINHTKHKIIITTIRKKVYDFSELKDIFVSIENSLDEKRFCNIIFVSKDNKEYTISGYLSPFKSKDVEKSRILVENLKKEISI